MGAISGMLGLSGETAGTGFGGPAMPNQQGMNNLQESFNQLQRVAAGQGPNPAMAQYNANIQNLARQQAGAISSVQGISPALATRMISQQGSGAMQNAAAQGAAMQAEQQLGAMGAMGNIAGMQAGSANQMQSNLNNINADLAKQTMQNQMGFIGGLFGGAGAAAGGGSAPRYAAGGMIDAPMRHVEGSGMDIPVSAPMQQPSQASVTQSLLSKFLSSDLSGSRPINGPEALQRGMTQFGAGMGQRMSAPPPAPVPAYAAGGAARDFRGGGGVRAAGPEQKAVKRGNSYANDKIPALLSEGEVVIPRSVMQSANPVMATADFVANVIAKRKARK